MLQVILAQDQPNQSTLLRKPFSEWKSALGVSVDSVNTPESIVSASDSLAVQLVNAPSSEPTLVQELPSKGWVRV